MTDFSKLDTFVDERDLSLLTGDRYTFSALSRILCSPCKVILSDHERGLMPMLYTDAAYPESNGCYRKIGCVLRGELSTLKRKEERQ